jgi:hypothetical protein
MIGKTISLAHTSGRFTLPLTRGTLRRQQGRNTSAQLSNSPPGFKQLRLAQTQTCPPKVGWPQWPPAKGQAGTRLKVKPKRPQMLATRNSFPYVCLIVGCKLE